MDKRKKVILDFMRDSIYTPMKAKEIAAFLFVEKARKEEFLEVLNELAAENKIKCLPSGKYVLNSALPEVQAEKAKETDTSENHRKKAVNAENSSENKTDSNRNKKLKSQKKIIDNYDFLSSGYKEGSQYTGVYTVSKNGFGFVAVPEKPDIFIPDGFQSDALNGDKVLVTIVCTEDDFIPVKSKGMILKVLEHANKYIVGLYKKNKKASLVIPDDRRILSNIYVPPENSMAAAGGSKVVVRIDDYSQGGRNPKGTICEILGDSKEPGVDILSIIKLFNLPEDFSAEAQAEALKKAAEPVEKYIDKRFDLRDNYTVTIDGEDAKDLDDAVSLSFSRGIWKLGIHIADVSHYVKEAGPLDREARERGTSVYLPDRVLPMLPPELSNGCCSLNAGEDKLTLSCIMDIDDTGKLISHNICETIIRVDKRLSYNQVYEILQDNSENSSQEYTALIHDMHRLALLLRKKRFKRGSIDFNLPESKVILNTDGSVKEIKAYDRTDANKIIEEFMLIANETVAEEYFWRDLPFIYRVHDVPDMEKMRELSIFINNFGFSLITSKDEIHPKEIQKLLSKTEGSENEALISRMVLRSMKQARYQAAPDKHFGLAAKYYTHFTSPIRRYPDLQIHRIIKENLKLGISMSREEHYRNILEKTAAHASAMERRAAEAERDAIKYKMCEYMQDKQGQKFNGIISGMTKYGLYVTLENTVEGFVSIAELGNDYYDFIERRYEIVGMFDKASFRLGEPITVKVKNVNKMARTIDFVCCKEDRKNRKGKH